MPGPTVGLLRELMGSAVGGLGGCAGDSFLVGVESYGAVGWNGDLLLRCFGVIKVLGVCASVAWWNWMCIGFHLDKASRNGAAAITVEGRWRKLKSGDSRNSWRERACPIIGCIFPWVVDV